MSSPRPETAPGAPGARTILFVTQHLGFVRNYEPTLRLLAERGHRIQIAFQVHRPSKGETAFAERLDEDFEHVAVVAAPAPASGRRLALLQAIRMLIDYLRYFDSRFRNATALRERVEWRVHFWARLLARVASFGGDGGVRLAIRLLQRLDRAIPADRGVRDFVAAAKPDLVLVTPLVDWASTQVEFVKAARELGVPSALGVASWDNLTNKGHVRVLPDRVFVWNEAQREEAVTLHGARPDQVAVTGAQLFDHWFARGPSRTREQFCRDCGLDPERPFVLFLGSSQWLSPAEVFFVERWIGSVRGAADPAVAGMGILLRPHPSAARRYLSLDLTHTENVAFWPPYNSDRSSSYTQQFNDDFFDSLWYSAACVGVNTSALIEAAILGRPVLTLRSSEFEHAQEGTLHFAHLAHDGGGVLRVADDEDAHLRHLGEAILGVADDDGERIREFVRSFVRPRGLDLPAAPLLADEIEAAAGVAAPARRPGVASLPVRAALTPLALGLLLAESLKRPEPLWLRAAKPLLRLWVGWQVRKPARGAERAARRERQAGEPGPDLRTRVHRLRRRARKELRKRPERWQKQARKALDRRRKRLRKRTPRRRTPLPAATPAVVRPAPAPAAKRKPGETPAARLGRRLKPLRKRLRSHRHRLSKRRAKLATRWQKRLRRVALPTLRLPRTRLSVRPLRKRWRTQRNRSSKRLRTLRKRLLRRRRPPAGTAALRKRRQAAQKRRRMEWHRRRKRVQRLARRRRKRARKHPVLAVSRLDAAPVANGNGHANGDAPEHERADETLDRLEV